jgi:hypothetical protein
MLPDVPHEGRFIQISKQRIHKLAQFCIAEVRQTRQKRKTILPSALFKMRKPALDLTPVDAMLPQ